MKKSFRGKLGLFMVIVLAVVGGGLTDSIVRAAIPDSNGVIHACYTTGVLAKVKIIDSATQSCGPLETPISWSQSGGSSTALVSLNDDGTLNTQYSRGVSSIKLVRDGTNQTYNVCFDLTSPPVWGTSSGGGYEYVTSSSIPTDVSQVSQLCGAGYNAVSTSWGDPSVNPYSSPYSSIRYIFWN